MDNTTPLLASQVSPQIDPSTALRSAQDDLGGESLLKWCVDYGPHPNQDGWCMLFRFPNGLNATVVWGVWTRGIEVGVRDGDWLVDVFEDLSGADVVGTLFEIMKRSLA